MTTFDNDLHRILFLTGSTLLSAEKIVASELILKALKQAGLAWRLEIGTTQPGDTSKIWLDKATDPDTVKIYNSDTGLWEAASSSNEALLRLLGAGETGIDVLQSDTPDEGRTALGINIINQEIDPLNYGATGGDPEADEAGIAAAAADARDRGRPVFLSGTLAIRPPASSSFNLFGHSDYPVRVAIPVQSGDRWYSRGCELIMRPPAATWTPGANERFFVFGTTSGSTSQSVYDDIDFEGLTFNFDEEEWGMSYSYAFGFVGADNIRRRRCIIHSTGAAYGRGLLAFNCQYLIDEDIRHKNITQGYYAKYLHNATVRDARFRALTEAIDLDELCIGGRWSGLTFQNLTGEAQCIDGSGIQDTVFENIYADNCGAVVFLYNKDSTHANYAGYADYFTNGTPVASPQSCKNVVVRNVFAKDCGSAGEETFRISNDRGVSTVADVVDNVSLEDWTIEGGFGGIVYECSNLKIRNMTMRNVVGYVSGNNNRSYALVLRQSIPDGATGAQTAASRLSGVVENVTIDSCSAGGLLVLGPGDVTLRNISVSNYNTGGYQTGSAGAPNYGIVVGRIGIKPNSVVTFEGRINVSGGPAYGTDLALTYLSGSSAGQTRIVQDRAQFSLASIVGQATAIPLTHSFTTLARYDAALRVPVALVDSVTNSTTNIPLTEVMGDDQYFKVQSFFLTTADAITGSATNYTAVALQRLSGGTASSISSSTINIDDAAVSADTLREASSMRDTTDADATIGPGETLIARFTRAGTGSVLRNMILEIRGLRYRRVVGS